MRDYQPIKNNPYILPHALYMQVVWLIRDYDRMREEYESSLEKSPAPHDGQPRSGSNVDSTQQKALTRVNLWTKIEAVDQALNTVPEEYQQGVWNNVVYRVRYPDDAEPRTYRRYKSKFIYMVAKICFGCKDVLLGKKISVIMIL